MAREWGQPADWSERRRPQNGAVRPPCRVQTKMRNRKEKDRVRGQRWEPIPSEVPGPDW